MSPSKAVTTITNAVALASSEGEIDCALAIWERFTLGEFYDAKLLEEAIGWAEGAVASGAALKLFRQMTAPAGRREIATAVLELTAAWPSQKNSDLQVFSRLLSEHVESTMPGLMALRAAFNEVIGTKTFLPAVAEVKAAVEAKNRYFAARAELVKRLPQRIKDAKLDLETRQPPKIIEAQS